MLINSAIVFTLLFKVLFLVLWYFFSRDAWKSLNQYHTFRSSRMRGSYIETIRRNPKEAIIVLIGPFLFIEFIWFIFNIWSMS